MLLTSRFSVHRRGRTSRSLFCVTALTSLLAAPSAASADDEHPVVDVSVAHPPGLAVFERRAPDGDWSTVCVPPCTMRLGTGDDYRIGGTGVVDSDVFRIPPADRVRVDATAGSSLGHTLGAVFAVGGFAFAGLGGAILLLPPDANASDQSKSDKTFVGVGTLVLGAASVAIGLALRALTDTSVRVAVEP
jgi:hypothetical protein